MTSYQLQTKYTLVTRLGNLANNTIDTLVIPKATISRRHALIEYRDYGFWLIDQNSVNGTFVNNQQVTDPVRLKHGDRIAFHEYEFEFANTQLLVSNETIAST